MTRRIMILSAIALIVSCAAGCSDHAQDITNNRVQAFCAKHGGIQEDATDEGEDQANHFTINCQDGTSVTGKNGDPDSLIYSDSNGHLIDE